MPGLGLVAVFAGSAVLALGYYHAIPDAPRLRARLPNRPSVAGILLFLILFAIGIYIGTQRQGLAKWWLVLALLFDLLIFETFFLLLIRWVKSNTVAVLVSLGAAIAMFWWQMFHPNTIVYNVTFILATLGATTLLVRLNYLRTKMLFVVAVLWSIYDVLSTTLIYPHIYRLSDRPHTSFAFPAVAVGNLTLGSGDFMFLVLFSLILRRDLGWRAAWLHIALQAVALVATITVKPDNAFFPYLTVMSVVFIVTYVISRKWFRVQTQTG